jgi:hypothetical protein
MLLRDGVRSHPKVLKAGAEAAWFWACCIDYSRSQLTDGVVPDEALPTLANCRSKVDVLVQRLVDVGLLHRLPGGVQVHDYLEHNDSAEAVREAKKRDAERKRGRVNGVESETIPDGIHLESGRNPNDSRARVGVGVGKSVGIHLEGRGPERGPDALVTPDAEAYAEVWRAIAKRHGVDLRIGLSRTDGDHVMAIAEVYSLDEFTSAAQAFWESPHITGRNIGLFRSVIAEALAHARSGATWPMRGKAPATVDSRAEIAAARAAFVGRPA